MKNVELHEYSGNENTTRDLTQNTTYFLTKCGYNFMEFKKDFYRAVEFNDKNYKCKPKIKLDNKLSGVYMTLEIDVVNNNNFPLYSFESQEIAVLSEKYNGDLIIKNESDFTLVIKKLDFSPLELLIDTLESQYKIVNKSENKGDNALSCKDCLHSEVDYYYEPCKSCKNNSNFSKPTV